MKKENLDSTSLRILRELQRNARLTVQDISDLVGLSPTPCWKRIKDMEAGGVILGYTARVNRHAVGLKLKVLAEVNLTPHNEDTVQKFEAAVAATPEIVGCYSTTGQADYLLTLLVADIEVYESVLQRKLFNLPGVAHVRSSIVLKEVKAESALPL